MHRRIHPRLLHSFDLFVGTVTDAFRDLRDSSIITSVEGHQFLHHRFITAEAAFVIATERMIEYVNQAAVAVCAGAFGGVMPSGKP
jgi:hypothetical protein